MRPTNRTRSRSVLVDAAGRKRAGHMIRLSFASVGLAALGLLSAPTAARADIIQPWCLSGGGGLTDRCDFATYAQCQQTAGGYGVCSPNPAFAAPPPPAIPAPVARHGKR
jgi:Protein of unknown function (DUF3551)